MTHATAEASGSGCALDRYGGDHHACIASDPAKSDKCLAALGSQAHQRLVVPTKHTPGPSDQDSGGVESPAPSLTLRRRGHYRAVDVQQLLDVLTTRTLD